MALLKLVLCFLVVAFVNGNTTDTSVPSSTDTSTITTEPPTSSAMSTSLTSTTTSVNTNGTTPVNACQSNPCGNGGTCNNMGDTFTCNCRNNLTGTTCNDTSTITTEPPTSSAMSTSLTSTTTSVNTNGTTPVNACQSNPCGNGGTCNNRGGTFTCNCRNNLTGTTCNECGVPSIVNGTVVDSNKTYSFGQMFNWSCDTGYIANPSASVCTSNGWTSAPSCILAKCQNISSGLVYGHIKEIKTSANYPYYNSTMTYICEPNYHIAYGNDTRKCEMYVEENAEHARWSINTPQCEEIQCTDPQAPEHGYTVFSNGRSVGRLVTFICHDGYIVDGNKVLQCNQNGTWNDTGKRNTSCEPISCSLPTLPDNGIIVNPKTTVSTSSTTTPSTGKPATAIGATDAPSGTDVNISSPYRFGDTISYSCKTGYKLNGENTSTCLATKKWSPRTATCELVVCGKTNLTSPLVFNAGNSTYNTTGNFSCPMGYNLTGNTASICLHNGSWSWHNTSCVMKECQKPSTPSFGNVTSYNTTTYQSNITYICNEGYKINGTQKNFSLLAYCEDNGDWNPEPPTCVIQDCGTVLTQEKGITNYTLTTYKSTVHYVCETGYKINDTNNKNNKTVSAVCNADGEWTPEPPACVIQDCGQPNNQPNAAMNFTTTQYKSKASLVCNLGYRMKGTNTTKEHTISCKDNGTWGDPIPCIIQDCKTPKPPTNGNVTYTNTTYNSEITYTCKEGFKINGTTSNSTLAASCTDAGHWSRLPPVCVIQDCGQPIKPGNGTTEGNSTTYNSSIKYRCNDGYKINETNSTEPLTANCTKYGNWSHGTPQCVIQDCGLLPASIEHGVLVNSTGHTYNNNATYACNPGFQTTNNTVLKCGANGSWDHEPPTCNDIDECKNKSTTHCHWHALCNNTVGSYTCKCKYGYFDPYNQGKQCNDVNECGDKNGFGDCRTDQQQTLKCRNSVGSFYCMCNIGWTGKYCDDDINECNTSPCGTNANCTNTGGGYSCFCDSSLPKGDPHLHCYQAVVLDMKSSADKYYQGDNKILQPVGMPVVMFYGRAHNVFRPSLNGFIALEYQPLYRRYGPHDASGWSNATRNQTVIAPLWADLDSTGINGSGLYLHLLHDNDVDVGKKDDLKTITSLIKKYYANEADFTPKKGFKPTFALVATWRNVTMKTSRKAIDEVGQQNATMQFILVTDGINTFLLFNYAQDQWSLVAHENMPPAAGYSYPSGTGNVIATIGNYTKLTTGSNVEPALNGRWLFNVTTKSIRQWNELDCQKLLVNDSALKTWVKQQLPNADHCPCKKQDVLDDYTFTDDTEPDISGQPVKCFIKWFFNNYGIKQKCCYGTDGFIASLYPQAGLPEFQDDPHNTTNLINVCCSKDGGTQYCREVYDIITPDDCNLWYPEY